MVFSAMIFSHPGYWLSVADKYEFTIFLYLYFKAQYQIYLVVADTPEIREVCNFPLRKQPSVSQMVQLKRCIQPVKYYY